LEDEGFQFFDGDEDVSSSGSDSDDEGFHTSSGSDSEDGGFQDIILSGSDSSNSD